jgi:hypothetical protein
VHAFRRLLAKPLALLSPSPLSLLPFAAVFRISSASAAPAPTAKLAGPLTAHVRPLPARRVCTGRRAGRASARRWACGRTMAKPAASLCGPRPRASDQIRPPAPCSRRHPTTHVDDDIAGQTVTTQADARFEIPSPVVIDPRQGGVEEVELEAVVDRVAAI